MQAPTLSKQQAEEGRVVFPLPVPLLAGRSSFWACGLVPAVCGLMLSPVGGKGLGTWCSPFLGFSECRSAFRGHSGHLLAEVSEQSVVRARSVS